jgi:hypothetical protein
MIGVSTQLLESLPLSNEHQNARPRPIFHRGIQQRSRRRIGRTISSP